VRRVIDPSLGFRKPVTVDEWIQAQTTKPELTVTGSTSKEVYLRKWDAGTESWADALNVLRDSYRTHEYLNGFRESRATTLPVDSGRRIPNKLVHY
jgi:hypothetical protein